MAIQARLESTWAHLDEDAPAIEVPNSLDLPLTSLPVDEDTIEWAPVRAIMGEGGNDGGWGRFNYRPESSLRLTEHFVRNVDALKDHPVKGARYETPFGPLYSVTIDGRHRLAAAKGVGLPYLPFRCAGGRYETAGLIRAGLQWQLPQVAEVPQLFPPVRRKWLIGALNRRRPGITAVRRETEGWERVALWRTLLEKGHLHGDLARMKVHGEDSVILRIDSSSPRPWLLSELSFFRSALRRAYDLSLPTMADLELPALSSERREALVGIPDRDVYQVLRMPNPSDPSNPTVYLRTPGTEHWAEEAREVDSDVHYVLKNKDRLTAWTTRYASPASR